MPDALLLVGRDRFSDPWHDFVATGACVARELSDLGATVTWRSTFPETFHGLERPDIVVVLAGRRSPARDEANEPDGAQWRGFHDKLADFVAAGTALLALHSAANTFGDSPHWERLIGGRWVEGTSMHPPIGDAVFDPIGSHQIISGVGAVYAFDEQYLGLDVAPSSQPFLSVRQDDAVHIVSWVANPPGGKGRVVYDGLGHDTRSYKSTERVALLRSEIKWLLAAGLAPGIN